MATLSAKQILERLDSIESLEVREYAEGSMELVRIADKDDIRDLCSKGQVCASARGQFIRYLELLVPRSELAPSSTHIERARSGCVGEDSRTVRRGEDLLANTYSHDVRRCGAYGGSREAYFALGS